MTEIGVISDTHGLLRPEALDALQGVSHILHAGDVVSNDIIPQLEAIAPVTVVRGNCDGGSVGGQLPMTETVQIEDAHIYMVHIREDLDIDPVAAGMHAVVFGHTHKPYESIQDGVLYYNPGSAGPRRFDLPITLARWTIDGTDIKTNLIELVAQ